MYMRDYPTIHIVPNKVREHHVSALNTLNIEYQLKGTKHNIITIKIEQKKKKNKYKNKKQKQKAKKKPKQNKTKQTNIQSKIY